VISQRAAPGAARSLLGKGPAQQNALLNARVGAQRQGARCRNMRSGLRGHARRVRVRPPRRKQRAPGSACAERFSLARHARRKSCRVHPIHEIVTTKTQRTAAKRNIKKAAKAARRKRTIAHPSKKTRTALGKKGAEAARKKRSRSK
jgi:hypothetical protein